MMNTALVLMCLILPFMVNVAFLTLFERKILSYSQKRKGPNKVSMVGLLQPVSDALKLLTNEYIMVMGINKFLYSVVPALMLFIVLFYLTIIPYSELTSIATLSWLVLILFMTLSVYPLFMSGWSSNNKYSMIGSIRFISQTLSYEVVFSMIVILFSLMINGLAINQLIIFNNFFLFMSMIIFLFFIWFFTCVAECSRAPFDFAEGESELVSGFNTEYMSALFALIFLSEYMAIIVFSILSSALFFKFLSSGLFFCMMSTVCFLWMWLRSTFPRHRYDLLMMLSWKSLMPISVLILISMMILK